jgi:hypothetical protein
MPGICDRTGEVPFTLTLLLVDIINISNSRRQDPPLNDTVTQERRAASLVDEGVLILVILEDRLASVAFGWEVGESAQVRTYNPNFHAV